MVMRAMSIWRDLWSVSLSYHRIVSGKRKYFKSHSIHQKVDCNVLMIVVMLISIAVKLWMSIFNKKIGMKIESDTLIATAADSRNDVISTSAVVVATILCKVTGWNIIDGIAGIGVAVFILYSGIGLIKETLSPLLGKVPAAEFVNHITEKIQSYPGVIGVHDLMIHDYGPGNLFATVHVEFPAETPGH